MGVGIANRDYRRLGGYTKYDDPIKPLQLRQQRRELTPDERRRPFGVLGTK